MTSTGIPKLHMFQRPPPPGMPSEEAAVKPEKMCDEFVMTSRHNSACQVPAFVCSAAPHPGYGCVGVVLVALRLVSMFGQTSPVFGSYCLDA